MKEMHEAEPQRNKERQALIEFNHSRGRSNIAKGISLPPPPPVCPIYEGQEAVAPAIQASLMVTCCVVNECPVDWKSTIHK
jgi:hypothetical protein